VAAVIEQGVRAHLRQGNHQIDLDSLGTLWLPAVFALLALLGGRLSGRPRCRGLPPRLRLAQPPGPDPYVQAYRQACSQLGVAPGSSWAVIRPPWHLHLSSWHPERGGDPELGHTRLATCRLLEARRAAAARCRAHSSSPVQALKALRRGIG
jgi:hypothetical protein